jgi:hypothetical protein
MFKMENQFSYGTSAILQQLLDGLPMHHNAFTPPLILLVTRTTVFGQLVKNSSQKVLSSAPSVQSAPMLMTMSNVIILPILPCALQMLCANGIDQDNGILNISLANHTLMEVILLTLLQLLQTTALASLATNNAWVLEDVNGNKILLLMLLLPILELQFQPR